MNQLNQRKTLNFQGKVLSLKRSPLSPPNMKFNGVSIAKSSYQPFRTEKQTNNKN